MGEPWPAPGFWRCSACKGTGKRFGEFSFGWCTRCNGTGNAMSQAKAPSPPPGGSLKAGGPLSNPEQGEG